MKKCYSIFLFLFHWYNIIGNNIYITIYYNNIFIIIKHPFQHALNFKHIVTTIIYTVSNKQCVLQHCNKKYISKNYTNYDQNSMLSVQRYLLILRIYLKVDSSLQLLYLIIFICNVVITVS